MLCWLFWLAVADEGEDVAEVLGEGHFFISAFDEDGSDFGDRCLNGISFFD